MASKTLIYALIPIYGSWSHEGNIVSLPKLVILSQPYITIALRVKIADLEDNMDIRRFDELTERDLDRLNKYLKAWRDLTREK